MSDSWSQDEVEQTVADYFSQFEKELARRPYNKAAHTRQLRSRLNGRTQSSVQFKYQNISAVLLNLGKGTLIAAMNTNALTRREDRMFAAIENDSTDR